MAPMQGYTHHKNDKPIACFSLIAVILQHHTLAWYIGILRAGAAKEHPKTIRIRSSPRHV